MAREDQTAQLEVSVDRFADIEVLRYRVPGFEELTLEQKKLAYYLYEAALSGRDILWDQNYKHNLTIRRTLEAVVESYPGERGTEELARFEEYVKRVWFANGIHHHYSTAKFVPRFSRQTFGELVGAADPALLPLAEGETATDLAGRLEPILFAADLDAKRVNLAPDVDQVVASANNYYAGVTQKEVEDFYAARIDPDDPRAISWGLNSQLAREDGKVVERVWKVGGMYSAALERIVHWLEKAGARVRGGMFPQGLPRPQQYPVAGHGAGGSQPAPAVGGLGIPSARPERREGFQGFLHYELVDRSPLRRTSGPRSRNSRPCRRSPPAFRVDPETGPPVQEAQVVNRDEILKTLRTNLANAGIEAEDVRVQPDPFGGWRIAVVAAAFADQPLARRRAATLAGLEDLDVEWIDLLTPEDREWAGDLPGDTEPEQLPLWPEALARGVMDSSAARFPSDLDDDLTPPIVATFYALRGGVGRSTAWPTPAAFWRPLDVKWSASTWIWKPPDWPHSSVRKTKSGPSRVWCRFCWSSIRGELPTSLRI